eukprot:Skav202406  [mRNA]  locus=scaffold815:503422:504891:+ [translate_table: standard]
MGACSDVWQVLKIYWSLLLGNVLEWYEFAVFGFLEPYFQSNFFDGSAPMTWLGFASTFLARPFGGIVLGVLGDLFGRKVSTFLSIFGMLIGTVGQGLVPTYQSGPTAGAIGVALLVTLRILQGICTGGEIAAVSTYITEVGPKRSLARSMVLIGITCNVGFLLAQFASYLALEILGEENMVSWGWRIPFIFALLPGVIAAFGRKCIPETGSFLEAKAAQQSENAPHSAVQDAISKLKSLFRFHRPALLVGMLSVAAIAVVQYGALAWCYVLLRKEGASSWSLITAGVVARGLAILMAPLAGWLGDIKGVAWIQFLGAMILAVAGIPLFLGMQSHVHSDEAVIVCYGFGYGIILAFTGMVYFLYVVDLFPVEIRNVGVGMSYNIGFCIFGGFAPLICEALHKWAFWAPGCFLACGGIIVASTVLFSLGLQSRGILCLAHIRADPYFEAGPWKSKQGKPPKLDLAGKEDAKEAPESAKCPDVTGERFQAVL